MARIYVKPQARNRPPSRPRNLDYGIIEQIANGIEKMVAQWNNAKETRARRHGKGSRLPSSLKGTTVSKEHGETVQNGTTPRLSREQEISTVSNSLGASEMSIFVRNSAALDGIIPELIRSEMAKQSQENKNEVHHVNTSLTELWYKARGGNAEDNKQDGNCSTGITPRVEAAVRNIEAKFNASSAEAKFNSSVQEDICESGFVENDYPAQQTGRSDQTETSSYQTGSNDREDDWATGHELLRELAVLSKQKEDFKVKEKEELLDDYKVKVEELQIALLERSAEYEVKIVEMKMMMLDMKSKYRQQQLTKGTKTTEPMNNQQQGKRSIETLRKEMQRLKEDKIELGKELISLKQKQRQSEKQKKNLDEALNKVSTLKRELARRDEEILDSHIREKEAKAHLNGLHTALQNARVAQAEPGKLISLLPVLRNWLNSARKVSQNYQNCQDPVKNMENSPPRSIVDAKIPLSATTKENGKGVDKIVGSVTKEIQALQKALEKLASGRYIS